jgi:hypothetical protein
MCHHGIRYNDTLHNQNIAKLHIMLRHIKSHFLTFIMFAVMLSVIILSVVAPFNTILMTIAI